MVKTKLEEAGVLPEPADEQQLVEAHDAFVKDLKALMVDWVTYAKSQLLMVDELKAVMAKHGHGEEPPSA